MKSLTPGIVDCEITMEFHLLNMGDIYLLLAELYLERKVEGKKTPKYTDSGKYILKISDF